MTIPEQIEARKKALSVEDFAKMLDVSVWSVYRMIKKQGLPAMHLLSGIIRLDPATTAHWLRAQTSTKVARRSCPVRPVASSVLPQQDIGS
jgi:predicted DNA-binding transcriptional regulator YafY